MGTFEPSNFHTELIGVYCEAIDWERLRVITPGMFDNPETMAYYQKCNEPAVLVELHVWGATFWSTSMAKPGFDLIGVEFDPFEIRQQHTKVEDTHYCDYVFLNCDGTAHHDQFSRFDLRPTDNFRVLMCIRRFNDQEPILTPYRRFASYTVTAPPDRLNGLSLFFLCPD